AHTLLVVFRILRLPHKPTVGSYERWWIDKTGYSPCMDDSGLPILVNKVHSHILSDLKMLKEFRHPNLVKVIGYYKGETNLLVSKFVHNRNFEDLLHSGTIGLLPLAMKVKIAVGIARGIVYLCNTTNNVGKVSDLSQHSRLGDWDKSIWTFKLDRYKILVDKDFTAKLSEYDISKLLEDYDKRDLRYDVTGPPEVDFTLERKIFSSFRSLFTEVLTGRRFSIKEFHKIDNSLRKDGKQSLGLVAKLCYENCNTIDSEQMMLKYFEEYENHIHMGQRHLRGEGAFSYQIQSSPYADAGGESIPESMRLLISSKNVYFKLSSNRW
nr:hypothetical protein [Tanacetum cinerariifolium]